MNYRSQLRRRLLASSLLSTGLLSLTGCGLSAALQREPDHVYSTTTPQMIEQEAAEASRPVEARYPEQARLFPHSHRSANGLKFRPVSLLTASAGFDETEADGEEGVISLGRPQTAVPVSQPVPATAPAGMARRFHPAEPRLATRPDGSGLPRTNTIAASPLADLFPDEYLFDGGDRAATAAIGSPTRSGLDSEDTVGSFRDASGNSRTVASNRVAIYAPRFGSVRTTTGLAADTRIEKAAGARDAAAVGSLNNGTAPQASVADDALVALESRHGADGMMASLPPAQSLNRERPVQSQKADKGRQSGDASAAHTFLRKDASVLAQQARNAEAWTRQSFPQIFAATASPSAIRDVQKTQQTVGVEDQREGGVLQLVKLADVQTAQTGDVVRFTIRFRNTGELPLSDVRIVDNLTPRLQYVEGSASIDEKHPGTVTIDPNGEGSSVLTFVLDGELEANGTGTITFETTVR